MFLKSRRVFLTAEQSKPWLELLVQPQQNCNKRGFTSKHHIKTLTTLPSERKYTFDNDKTIKLFHTSASVSAKKPKDPKWIFTRTNLEVSDDEHSLIYNSEFIKPEKKTKKAFLEVISIFRSNVKGRSSQVDFMRSALSHMKAYGVERDLECYKKIIDVLPKGVFICTNVYMAEGMYFPRQQFATLEVLSQMEDQGVAPDVELGDLLTRIFGSKSQPHQKYARMMYWTLKMRNKSPWLLPQTLPKDVCSLAKLAIERITSVDIQTEISVYQTEKLADSIDKTWILSGQSPKQKKLLTKHPKDVPVIVEGGDVVWLREKCISYFVLKADGEPLPYVPPKNVDDISNLKSKYFNPNYIAKEDEGPNVHVQDDGKIYAVCATGTSSKDSLLSWVRILEKQGNPILADVPVLFRLKQPQKIPVPFTQAVTTQQ